MGVGGGGGGHGTLRLYAHPSVQVVSFIAFISFSNGGKKNRNLGAESSWRACPLYTVDVQASRGKGNVDQERPCQCPSRGMTVPTAGANPAPFLGVTNSRFSYCRRVSEGLSASRVQAAAQPGAND